MSTVVIAQQLGLSQAALFKRFGTKDQLLAAALLPQSVPAWIIHVEKGPDDREILVQLLEIAELMMSFFHAQVPCLATLRASGLNLQELMSRYDQPPPLRGRAALSRWFQQAMDQGRIRRVSPAAPSVMLIGTLHGRAFLEHIARGDPDSVELHDLVELIWRGLTPEDRP